MRASNDPGVDLGSGPATVTPVPYVARTRAYYAALGYENAYRWAQFADVPFTRLDKPLARCRVTIVTTAAPYQPGKGDQGPGARYNGAAKFFSVYSFDSSIDPDLRIAHVAIDRRHTTAEDIGSYFPGRALSSLVESGRVGSMAARFHGLPTNRSQRVTINVDCPTLVSRCREDQVDVAVLVPNCPVCHQSTALAARALESSGIATVILGCAKDIVELAGVPRFVFSDFPLGNAAGRPHDVASQAFTLELAMRLLESAEAPRTTVQSPLSWSEDPAWKLDYCNVDRLSADALRQLCAEFESAKSAAAGVRAAPERTSTIGA